MAGEDELKLLGTWASPWVSRVKLALHLKGLSYENVEQDLDDKRDLLLTSNPVHKKVPVLIHNGKPICESVVILEYIDEAYGTTGPSLLPTDPYERAIARFWVDYIDQKLVIPWKVAFTANGEEEKTEGMKQMLAVVQTLEGALKECSKGKPFFGGDSVGYVDIALGSLLAFLQGTEELCGTKPFDIANTPLLLAWVERFTALDATKVALPDVTKLVESAKTKRAQMGLSIKK
ncbi:probable glutathione S-transferase GSTU6 [Triticum dicoccoides]|uniref:probable glutathione S-transferase GSTU6 n=1 Tax=Triticum dicoccoides TaxID=85692 RepID=UPI0018901F50|nr:probable glutathione S-transferase GSTU6 [Triticum dicoccoides]